MGIIRAKQTDVSDTKIGRDLIISIARDQNKRPVIQSIVDSDPTPLTEDAELEKTWLGDERTWKDVYSVRTYEYLAIVVQGKTPTYSKEADGWVAKEDQEEKTSSDDTRDLDNELTMGGDKTEKVEAKTTTDTSTTIPPSTDTTTSTDTSDSNSDTEEDDLPF
jgi:hypothetical protein